MNNFIPILLDYFHGVAASLWIGGLIFLASVFINSIRKLEDTEIQSRIISIVIDKFSIIVLPILASIAITGPTLLWSLEDNLSTTFASLYGKILIIKLVLASAMIIIGAYHQLITSKKMKQKILVNQQENKNVIVSDGNNTDHNDVINKFKISLRIEAIIGISLLFVVSLMTNMVLPSGEIQSSSVDQNKNTFIDNTVKDTDQDKSRFSTILYNDDNKIKISIRFLSTSARIKYLLILQSIIIIVLYKV